MGASINLLRGPDLGPLATILRDVRMDLEQII